MGTRAALRRIDGRDLRAQLDGLRRDHPRLHACIAEDLVESWQRDLDGQDDSADDFGPDAGGGRGDHYIEAQTANAVARAHGIEQLLRLMRGTGGESARVVLDLLGGDGLLRKVSGLLGVSGIDILTCDASPHMVGAAWAAGLPALVQRADRLLARAGSVDGVLLAYGTHHIPAGDRPAAVEEAHRVLRVGGVFALHDFEIGGTMDDWFSQVVDQYSTTGHRFEHFTRDEIAGYLTKAGFEDGRVIDMADPYRATGDTPAAAELAMGRYLVNMYGLVKVEEAIGADEAARWAMERARQIFGRPGPAGTAPVIRPEFDKVMGIWRVEVPRTAIVGVAHRTAD